MQPVQLFLPAFRDQLFCVFPISLSDAEYDHFDFRFPTSCCEEQLCDFFFGIRGRTPVPFRLSWKNFIRLLQQTYSLTTFSFRPALYPVAKSISP